jgi:hypothetical protein
MSKQKTMTVGGVLEEFTLNSNGVKIKKCCASCANHEPHSSDGPKRLCKKHTTIEDGKEKPKVVDKSDLCGDWSISDMIDGIKLNR